MNYKMMGRFIAQILAVEAFFMLPALCISLFYGEKRAAWGFLLSFFVIAVTVAALFALCRGSKRGFYAKEGLACVGLSWIVMSLLGCLPFYFSGEIPHFVDAFFEIVSGFTTTGASILTDVEALSHGMLYWRSFSHWLGGMGVLVFLLAITPAAGQKGGFTMHLLRAESTGPDVGKLVPRMRQTAMILYLIYLSLTLLTFLFLLIGKMPVFDAVCTALGTAGTGGFGIKNDSMASYSPYLQNVCTVFMLLCGINFSMFYLLLLRHVRAVWKNEELRLYLGVIATSVALITLDLGNTYATLGETLRHAAFQVVSVITTTGFSTTDYDLWPGLSKSILLFLMVIGACAGSTGGGIKCGRALLLLKGLRRSTRKILHPNRVEAVRISGQTVDEGVLENTNAYLAAYFIIIIGSMILISTDEFSVTTNLSAVLACFNNIGPGLEAVGPTQSFAQFSVFSKLVLILDMLAGRLEIFPILVLFSRSVWRRR